MTTGMGTGPGREADGSGTTVVGGVGQAVDGALWEV